MIAILATVAFCRAAPPTSTDVQASVEGTAALANVAVSHPTLVHAEATGPRALSDLVFELAAANGWMVAYEDAPIRSPVDLVDAEHNGVPYKLSRSYTDKLDYDPAAGPMAVLTALVASHNGAGNPGTFEVRSYGDIADVVGIGALDATGKYRAVTPLLDTIVTLTPKMQTIDQAIEEVLHQVYEQTGQISGLGGISSRALRADTSASSAGATARSVILQLFLEGGGGYTWVLLQEANTDEWGFNPRAVLLPEPPSWRDAPDPEFPPPASRAP